MDRKKPANKQQVRVQVLKFYPGPKMPSTSVKNCAAENCSYVYQKGVRLCIFSFPFGAGTESLQEKWKKNMKVKEGFQITRNSSFGICEQHFLKKCFYDHEMGSRLKVGAVPTLLQVGEGNKKQWRKIASDYDALDEEHTAKELKSRVELDHTYRDSKEKNKSPSGEVVPGLKSRVELDHTYRDPKELGEVVPAKRSRTSEPTTMAITQLVEARAELADLKRQLSTQRIHMKRLEEKLQRRDSKKEDLQYAVERLKGMLQCCECGLKPSSDAELAKMIKRKKVKPERAAAAAQKEKTAPAEPTVANLPTKVVCRNDLVVGITWKQLFARVNSIAQGEDDD